MELSSDSCEDDGGDIVNTKALGIGLLVAILVACTFTVVSTESDAAPSITDIDYYGDSEAGYLHITASEVEDGQHAVVVSNRTDATIGRDTFASFTDGATSVTKIVLQPGTYIAEIYAGQVTVDVDPIAQLEFTVYTVSFDANGGTGSMDEVYATGTYVPPATAGGMAGPDGAEFLGWSTTADGEPVGSVEITRDTTLYAVWDSGEPSEPVAVDGVTLDESSITLVVGGNQTLVATVTPADADDKSVTWSSSNSSVATVTDGVVTAVSPGTVTITVTTVDGGYTATCQVTVEERAVTGIEATPDRSVYTVGDVFDDGVSVELVYNDGSREPLSEGYSVDASAVDMSTPGTYTVTVTYQTFTATFDVTVRAPGDVAISVTVIGGGPTNKVVLTVDGVETEFTRNGTLVVEEGSVVTVAYSTSGLLDPTITVGGEPISNGGTFVAGSDTTLRVVFFVDDDDDNPVNPPVVATGDDDDDVVYAVAIAAGVIVAVFVAVYVIYGRKD